MARPPGERSPAIIETGIAAAKSLRFFGQKSVCKLGAGPKAQHAPETGSAQDAGKSSSPNHHYKALRSANDGAFRGVTSVGRTLAQWNPLIPE